LNPPERDGNLQAEITLRLSLPQAAEPRHPSRNFA
jgi:hypothetical protein